MKNNHLSLPNQKEIKNARNLSNNNIVGDDWQCPSCERNLEEIVRWNRSINDYGYILHRHHDHGLYGKTLKNNTPYTIICEICNKVDAYYKVHIFRAARTFGIDIEENLSKEWSFTVEEIKSCINSEPHTLRHTLDKERGMLIASKKSGLTKYLLRKFNQ